VSENLQAEIDSLKRSLERERKGRKEAEEVLRNKTFELLEAKKLAQNNANRLQQALSASKQAVWEWDASTDEVWMYSNKSSELSKIVRRITKTQLIESLRPSHRQIFEQQFDAHSNGRSKMFSVLVERTSRTSGHKRWIRLTGQCSHRDSNGCMQRMLGTYKDITNQHKEREAYEMVTAAFVNAKIPQFIMLLDDQKVQINSAFASLFAIQGRCIDWETFAKLLPVDLIQSHQIQDSLAFCTDLMVHGQKTQCNIKLTEMLINQDQYSYISGSCSFMPQ
jgi:PAS domain-containing protein